MIGSQAHYAASSCKHMPSVLGMSLLSVTHTHTHTLKCSGCGDPSVPYMLQCVDGQFMGCALVLRALQLPVFDPATPLPEVLEPMALLVVIIVGFCVYSFDCRFVWWADIGPCLVDMQRLESIQGQR